MTALDNEQPSGSMSESGQAERGTTGMVLLALLPSWLAMAWLISKAQWFWNHRPDLQFGWIVVLLSAYLLWEAWPSRPQPQPRWSVASAGIGVTGLAMLFVVQLYQAAFGMMAAAMMGLSLGILLVVAANLHWFYGWAGLRHFGFSFAFLLVTLPLPSFLQGPIVSGLQSLVAAIDVALLNIIGIPAQQLGSLIHLPGGTVGIDEACSGIRSLQSTIMATLFIGYLSLRGTFMQLLLFAAGLALAVSGNVARSLFLSLAANNRGLEAVDQYHDAAGWSILLFTATGVALLAWGLAKLEQKIGARHPNKTNIAGTAPGDHHAPAPGAWDHSAH